MADHRAALGRLLAAATAGALDAVCERFGVEVLGAFGSATDPDSPELRAWFVYPWRAPRDLDLAVRIAADTHPDLVGLAAALHAVCGPAEIDLLDLRTAEPVATTAGLVGGVPLYEHRPGAFAEAQVAAVLEELDTAWLRRLELELLSS
ncbi:MAG: hypothetical protein H0T98_09335 [Euzebyaceae bacterium]|jgi:hypothetical protein|nr:hypothetical protein [Euzebyaceae bacterium]